MHYLKLIECLVIELSTPTTLHECMPMQDSCTRQTLSDNNVLLAGCIKLQLYHTPSALGT